MTTTTQQLLRDIHLFNMVFPIGTKLKANLVTGVTEVEVKEPAKLIGDEPMFKCSYGDGQYPLLFCSTVQIPTNYFADWFNEQYPVGTEVSLCYDVANEFHDDVIEGKAFEDKSGVYVTTIYGLANIKDVKPRKEVQHG